MILDYLKAFLVGGALCALGQVLIDRTKLTPARILTGYVVAGVILGALGVYAPLAEWAGAGATVPLTGFRSVHRRVHGRRGRDRRGRVLRLSHRRGVPAPGKTVRAKSAQPFQQNNRLRAISNAARTVERTLQPVS